MLFTARKQEEGDGNKDRKKTCLQCFSEFNIPLIFLMEIRIIVKILSHPWYSLIYDEFDTNSFFFEKKIQWLTQKNWVCQLPPKAEQLLPKFHRLVLGLVGLIDAKGINVTQPTWTSGCPMEGQKRAKNQKKAVLALLMITLISRKKI